VRLETRKDLLIHAERFHGTVSRVPAERLIVQITVCSWLTYRMTLRVRPRAELCSVDWLLSFLVLVLIGAKVIELS